MDDEVSPYDLYDASDIIKICRDIERGVLPLPYEEKMIRQWVDDYVFPLTTCRYSGEKLQILGNLHRFLVEFVDGRIIEDNELDVDGIPNFPSSLIDECLDGKRRISYNSRAFITGWDITAMRKIMIGNEDELRVDQK